MSSLKKFKENCLHMKPLLRLPILPSLSRPLVQARSQMQMQGKRKSKTQTKKPEVACDPSHERIAQIPNGEAEAEADGLDDVWAPGWFPAPLLKNYMTSSILLYKHIQTHHTNL